MGNNSNHRRFPQLKLHAALGSNVSFVVLLSKRLALKTITPASRVAHSSPQNTQRISAYSCTSSLPYSTSELKSLIWQILLFTMFLLFAHLNGCFPFQSPSLQVSLTFCCKVRRRTFSFIFYVLAPGRLIVMGKKRLRKMVIQKLPNLVILDVAPLLKSFVFLKLFILSSCVYLHLTTFNSTDTKTASHS